MKKKKIIIISLITTIVLAVIGSVILLTSKDNKEIVVNGLKKIEVLSGEDSAKSAELIKKNIVKVTNKIDDETKIIGTGFFHESGYLVTNSHIVDIEGNITVEYYNGETKEAVLFSNDITSDIALLSVESPQVLAMNFGNTLSLNVTDEVYAVGYAYALEGEASVSKGILSARRSAGGIEFLQSDLSLNTGNSGGPLINAKGELLGINTYATDNASIAMSISSESLEVLINKLIEDKKPNYLEEERNANALSVVLKEIGYEVSDIYGENDIIDKKFHKHDHEGKHPEKDNDTSASTNPAPTPTTPTVDYSTKSDNGRLASLTVEGYTLNFNPETLTYFILVKNQNVITLNINAVPQESESVVTIKNKDLEIGKTTQIEIEVLAPNKRNGYTYAIYVIKASDTLSPDRLSSIGVQNNLDYVPSKGQNCFVIDWHYKDRDNVMINMDQNNITAIVSSYTVEVYYGTLNETGDITIEGKTSRLLKSYNFNAVGIDGSTLWGDSGITKDRAYIPINDIRSLLTDEDYEGTDFPGKAPITFKVTLNTYKQGTLVGYGLAHIGK